ncbi:hypothetical protein JAO29_23135, partial [Edaphobacter sp. HDX4]
HRNARAGGVAVDRMAILLTEGLRLALYSQAKGKAAGVTGINAGRQRKA